MSRLLFATDGSPGAREAERYLIALHPRAGDVIHVVSVVDHPVITPASAHAARAHAAYVADQAVSRLRYAGCAAVVEAAEGPVAPAIIGVASRVRADLIVVGSRGRGRGLAALLGSTARSIIRDGTFPVLVVRGHPAAPQWILLAVGDVTAVGRGAHALALLSCPADAAVEIITPPTGGPSSGGGHLALVFEEAQRAFPHVDLNVHTAGTGRFATEILRYADQITADLIVLPLPIGDKRLAEEVLGISHQALLVVPTPTLPIKVKEPAGELAAAT